jgi:RNA polymerase sigma-70 factor (ECF subfamily)
MDQHRRRVRRDRTLPMFEPTRSLGESEGVELRDVVQRGLERLAPELRATVVLRFYADFPVADIALAMSVAEGTVKSRLHRAVAELRAALPKESLR